jgi:4-hydroxybenzoate polyprenyltransferase
MDDRRGGAEALPCSGSTFVLPATPVHPAPTHGRSPGRPVLWSLVLALRPRQWTKNLILFAALIFGERLLDPDSVLRASVAFIVFCLLSGIVYIVNDYKDRDADRIHPTKSRRPIASGDLPGGPALAFAAGLSVVALGMAFALSTPFGAVGATYLVLLVLYSVWLKHLVIMDALTLALGFVLRAWGGAVAIGVVMSHWLLLLTLLGALFLALSKRRAELVGLAGDATHHRPILAEYTPHLLDQMVSVVTASTLLAYALYTIDAETVARFGTDRLVWTLPFPLYGIFRYLYLVHRKDGGGNPSEILLSDRPLLTCVALWGAAIILLVYGPRLTAAG